MSMAKKVNPREAAAKKAAEEATRRALEKRKLEQEKEKEKERIGSFVSNCYLLLISS